MISRNAFVKGCSGLVLSGVVWSLPASAATAAASLDSNADPRGQIFPLLERLRQSARAPGLSAAVWAHGELVFSGGVGVANLETGSLQDGTTVYSIASISKTMTAVAVMQLVEQHKVRLDDPIQAYAPWFPVKQAPITVFELLTHTSGIRHYKDTEDPDTGQWTQAFRHYATYEESTRFWRDDPLLFTPGAYWYYSTFGFSLLQAVVETASGQPFEAYLRRHIWDPAGMVQTQLDVAGRIVPRRGQGYERDGTTGLLTRAADEDASYKYAAGGILSSDEDLCRYGAALNAGRLLSPASWAQMLRPQLPPNVKSFSEHDFNPDKEQAICWFRETDAAGRVYVDHSGDNKGTLSQLTDYWQQDVIVALHTNVDPTDGLAPLAEKIAQLYLA